VWAVTGRPPKAVDPDASASARLGAELRARRAERKLTLAQLGDEVGFSAQYISGAELAKTTVSARFVAACDHALGADGALVALLPDVVREKEELRDELALRFACARTEGGENETGPTAATLKETGAAIVLGSGSSAVSTVAADVDPALPGHWAGVLAILGAHDAMHGPCDVLPVARRELHLIAAYRQVAGGELRTELMRVEARWAVHVAWLCEDTGDRRGRAALLDHALQLARESDYLDLIAWVRARQAQWTDPFNAIRLAEAGLRIPRAGAPTRALCGVRAAYAHARIDDPDAASRLLAEAHELAAQDGPSPPLPADTPLSGYLVRCWEARCDAALQPATGVARYDAILRDWLPAVGRRDRGLYQARLAIACAAASQPDRARAEGRQALAIARATNSTTIARELRQLHDLLRA
jgi:transcriptional regulator with XRE-family HTH domain